MKNIAFILSMLLAGVMVCTGPLFGVMVYRWMRLVLAPTENESIVLFLTSLLAAFVLSFAGVAVGLDAANRRFGK